MKKAIPRHLAVIMDGNRRWAKKRGLNPWDGHRAGYAKAKEMLDWCRGAGIEILTLYSFSTKNWKRSKTEVNFILNLFYFLLTKEIDEIHKNNTRFRVIGSRNNLTEKLKNAIEKAENLTKNNNGGILNLAFNYEGREEITSAFNKILKKRFKEITEDIISQNLYTAGILDPDLIIRTSGEMRLSGFMPWQSSDAEFYFTKKCWPDFSKKDFNMALRDFSARQRRFGK